MQITIEQKTPVYLSPDEALLFMAFQKNYQVIARILGHIDALGIRNIANSSLVLDFDKDGMVAHTAITNHYRKELSTGS